MHYTHQPGYPAGQSGAANTYRRVVCGWRGRPRLAQTTLPGGSVLTADLEVTPSTAERGEDVTITLTLTNEGASPIGCETARHRSMLTVEFDTDRATDPISNTLFASEIAALESEVLDHGESHTLTATYTLPNNALHTQIEATVTGGSYDVRITDANLGAYKVQARTQRR